MEPIPDDVMALLRETAEYRRISTSGTTAEDHFVAGFIEAIRCIGKDVNWPEVKRALAGVSGPKVTREAEEEPPNVPEPPGEPGGPSDAEGVDPAERSKLRALFWKNYRQMSVVQPQPQMAGVVPGAGAIRPWPVLIDKFPGIERQAVRDMHDRLRELGPDEYRLLLWFFHSGGTLDEL